MHGLWMDTIKTMEACFVPSCQRESMGLVSKVGEGEYKRFFAADKETRLTIFYCDRHEDQAKVYFDSSF
jgi:hypothetical protein